MAPLEALFLFLYARAKWALFLKNIPTKHSEVLEQEQL